MAGINPYYRRKVRVQNLGFKSIEGDIQTAANQIAVYAKEVAGTTELFIRKESNGTEVQVTNGAGLSGAGSNGNVFYSGSATLAGQDGVTVTHNKGNTSYLVKTLPTGTGGLGRIGDISYVKAANTVVIYNSGHGGFPADIELSNVA